MNVGRRLLDGVHEDQVHEPNDGRLFAGALEVDDVFLGLGLRDLDLVLLELLHEGRDVRLLLVVARDRVADGLFARDDDLDIVAREDLQVVDGVQVRGVAHRHDQ